MEIRFNIQGEGKVAIEGTVVSGSSVTLNAIPSEPMRFGYYLIGDKKITRPIYVYAINGNEDVEIGVKFYMSMEDWLKAHFEYEIKRSTLMVAASSNGFSLDDDESVVSLKAKELAQADILYAICTSPSTIQGRTKKVGDWSETAETRGLTATDKRDMRAQANYLRSKWGENKTQVTATIRGWIR